DSSTTRSREIRTRMNISDRERSPSRLGAINMIAGKPKTALGGRWCVKVRSARHSARRGKPAPRPLWPLERRPSCRRPKWEKRGAALLLPDPPNPYGERPVGDQRVNFVLEKRAAAQ